MIGWLKRFAWGRLGCCIGMFTGLVLTSDYEVAGGMVFASCLFAAVALHGLAIWRDKK